MATLFWNKSNLIETCGKVPSGNMVIKGENFRPCTKDQTEMTETTRKAKIVSAGYIREYLTKMDKNVNPMDIASIVAEFLGIIQGTIDIIFHKQRSSDPNEGMDSGFIIFKPNQIKFSTIPTLRVTFMENECNEGLYRNGCYDFKCGIIGITKKDEHIKIFEHEIQQMEQDNCDFISIWKHVNRKFDAQFDKPNWTQMQVLFVHFIHNYSFKTWSYRCEMRQASRSDARKLVGNLSSQDKNDKKFTASPFCLNANCKDGFEIGVENQNYVFCTNTNNDITNGGQITTMKDFEYVMRYRSSKYIHVDKYQYYYVFECPNCNCSNAKGFHFQFQFIDT